jgi:phosphatidate phosphatase PAH1
MNNLVLKITLAILVVGAGCRQREYESNIAAASSHDKALRCINKKRPQGEFIWLTIRTAEKVMIEYSSKQPPENATYKGAIDSKNGMEITFSSDEHIITLKKEQGELNLDMGELSGKMFNGVVFGKTYKCDKTYGE